MSSRALCQRYQDELLERTDRHRSKQICVDTYNICVASEYLATRASFLNLNDDLGLEQRKHYEPLILKVPETNKKVVKTQESKT